MPPRTLSSAVALVSLASLTAIEAGGCSKRTESLRSASRAGLPLITSAIGSVSAEAAYSLADYGVRPVPGLQHLCGHYELGDNGELITNDLFIAQMSPEHLLLAISQPAPSLTHRSARKSGVSLQVSDYDQEKLPKVCRKLATSDSQSLLIASRVL